MDFPLETVRRKFPALDLIDKGRRRIYLDNPAGTQVPQAVADAVARCLLTTNANLGGYFETTVAAQKWSTTRMRRWPISWVRQALKKSSSAPT